MTISLIGIGELVELHSSFEPMIAIEDEDEANRLRILLEEAYYQAKESRKPTMVTYKGITFNFCGSPYRYPEQQTITYIKRTNKKDNLAKSQAKKLSP